MLRWLTLANRNTPLLLVVVKTLRGETPKEQVCAILTKDRLLRPLKMQKKLWDSNRLICGDNLTVLSTFEDECIDLIYIDPPFFSHRTYEVIWGDEAEVRSFKDRWAGGIEHYIGWMEERVKEMHRVLKPTGSMYLHCDWHASHHLRVMMDRIFGEGNFQNEVIWYYQTGGATKIRYSRKHDNILFYTKGKKWTFNSEAIKIKRTEKSLQRAQNPKGARISKTDIYKNPDDVFIIPQMNPMAKERLGYPTQKPEALLERIVKASSNKGDLVLDAFAGCGTALAVAQKLGRQWVGIDISPTATKLMEKRLGKLGARDIIVTGLPQSVKHLKELEPFEFQNWVINEMGAHHSRKKVGDMGIDGYFTKTLFREAAVIQVKQSKNVGRNVVDNFETAMRRAKKQLGYIVAFGFSKGAYEEAARVKSKEKLTINLITVEELLKKQGNVTF